MRNVQRPISKARREKKKSTPKDLIIMILKTKSFRFGNIIDK